MRIYYLLFLILAVFKTVNLAQGVTYTNDALNVYINGETGSLWHSRTASAMDSMIRNRMLELQAQLMQMNQMIIKQEEGRLRINAGKATTKITYSPKDSISEAISLNSATPQEKEATRQSVSIALQTFNNILKAKRLVSYDSADGDALAFVLAYLVYNDGEDPGDTRLYNLAQKNHVQALKNQYLQGMTNAERQKAYENLALQTMFAVRAYEISKRLDVSDAIKTEARTMAHNYAGQVLQKMWPSNVSGISLTNSGFGDKGESIIKSGAATTVFVRSDKLVYGEQFARSIVRDPALIKKWMRDFDTEALRRGGAINDTACANAVAFALAYEIYSLGGVKLNQLQFNWVLKEMQKDILADQKFQSFSNEEKQRYYEATALGVMHLYDWYQSGSRSADLRASAKTKLQDIFAPRILDQYSLTPSGFVMK